MYFSIFQMDTTAARNLMRKKGAVMKTRKSQETVEARLVMVKNEMERVTDSV